MKVCPKCNHVMKETMLFTSTVYDCSCTDISIQELDKSTLFDVNLSSYKLWVDAGAIPKTASLKQKFKIGDEVYILQDFRSNGKLLSTGEKTFVSDIKYLDSKIEYYYINGEKQDSYNGIPSCYLTYKLKNKETN